MSAKRGVVKFAYRRRLASLRAALRGVDALLVTNPVNIRYLTGFTGSSGYVLVTKTGEDAFFITDSRYGENAISDEAGYVTLIIKKTPAGTIKALLSKLGVKTLGFEPACAYAFYERLAKAARRLRPVRGLVEKLRAVKDAQELESIKTAVRRAEEAFLDIRPWIRAGVKENALAARLEERIRKRGSSGLPFAPIVASGENSAIPHARPSDRRMAPGDLVVIDWGAECDGYCSDMTRTFLIGGQGGKRLAEKRRLYRAVYEAQTKAVEFIKKQDSPLPKNIDNSARYVIKQAGYGAYFGHGLGHGVGLEVHELPGIAPRFARAAPVSDGMVFTIEPGVYLPGVGGARIEDMVFFRKGRPEVLTRLPKKLSV